MRVNRKIAQIACLVVCYSVALSGMASESEFLAAKEKVIKLAESSQGREDTDTTTRALLDSAIDELITAAADETALPERLIKAHGAWQQIWGPVSFGGLIKIRLDPENIFQYISEDGYIYSFGQSGGVTTFIRGEYALYADGISIQFTDSDLFFGLLPEGAYVKTITDLKESGDLLTLPLPLPATVNEPSTLSETYVDDSLRITYGGTHENPKETLSILRRITFLGD